MTAEGQLAVQAFADLQKAERLYARRNREYCIRALAVPQASMGDFYTVTEEMRERQSKWLEEKGLEDYSI